MKKPENIVESVNFVSEEDLLVQELDKRLSFDVLAGQTNGGLKDICDCLIHCDCLQKKFEPHPGPSTCGVRG